VHIREIIVEEQFKSLILKSFNPVTQEYNRILPATTHTQSSWEQAEIQTGTTNTGRSAHELEQQPSSKHPGWQIITTCERWQCRVPAPRGLKAQRGTKDWRENWGRTVSATPRWKYSSGEPARSGQTENPLDRKSANGPKWILRQCPIWSGPESKSPTGFTAARYEADWIPWAKNER
jgi:hypothetical protein